MFLPLIESIDPLIERLLTLFDSRSRFVLPLSIASTIEERQTFSLSETDQHF